MDNGEIHVHLACKLSRGRAQFKLDSLHLLWRQHANALFCLCDPLSAQGGCGEVHVCQAHGDRYATTNVAGAIGTDALLIEAGIADHDAAWCLGFGGWALVAEKLQHQSAHTDLLRRL